MQLQNKKSITNKLGFLNPHSFIFKLTAYLVIFTSLLIVGMWFYLNQPLAGEGELEAQEAYLYAKMVESWGSPSDTTKVSNDINNISLNCAIFKLDQDWSEKSGEFGYPYWSSSEDFPDGIFNEWSIPEDFEEWVNLPKNNMGEETYVSLGIMNGSNATSVVYGDYVYYFGSNTSPPGEEWDVIIFLMAIITLMIILYTLLKINFLNPVLLMKQRVYEFEQGDLDSNIPVSGNDELASLAKSVNKMTENIRVLLNQKQMLLLDVSHELRTPLARMQLLVEMIPEHKNIYKLKEEIVLLEGIISNLLLSNKLSTPYTDLQLDTITIDRLILEVKKMFPDNDNNIKVITKIPDVTINVDELKMVLAIRNLLDNAIKYSTKSSTTCELSFEVEGDYIYILVTDYGKGIALDDIKKITEPFYRGDSKNNVKGFGIGLTIVKKVIEAHHGELIIKSKPNKGSSFTLKIPCKLN